MPKSLKAAPWSAAITLFLALNWASAFAQGTWTSLAPVPTPTEGMTVGGVGQVIIAAYGDSLGFGDTNLTRLYNISSNSWSLGVPGPLPPRAEEAYGETTHGGFLYVIGGRSAFCTTGVCNNLERYDPVTNTWATLTPMPTARAAAAAAVFDNSIYVIGGRLSGGGPCSGGPLSTVERYDIDTDTWTTVAPLPYLASDLAAREHGGKIYVFGGCNGFLSGFLNFVSEYDPVKNTWTTGLAPMPTARASLVAGIKGDNVYAIGGWNGVGAGLDVNEVYNISHNSWSTDAPMPTSRGEAGSHSHGGRIYVVGGSRPAFGASTNANEVFKPNP